MREINEREYADLLTSTLPHVIHTDEENERCIETLNALDELDQQTPGQERIAELLTLLIEDFEGRNHSLPSASPVEMVRFFIDQQDLLQEDMLDVFGTISIASEVLAGKRSFSKLHIAIER